MTRFAVIEHHSGFVWGVKDASDPIDACRQINDENKCEPLDYQDIGRRPLEHDTGYRVYEVPPDFDVDDGQEATAIASVEGFPLAANVTYCLPPQ